MNAAAASSASSASSTPAARLSLAPVLFNWPAEAKRDFYLRIADEAAVDMVYLGEVVCSKRTAFLEPHMAEIVARLEAAGKQVVLSTLALIMSAAEMDEVRALAARPGVLVEANDVATLALLAGTPHVVGPFVNVYNEGTLGVLAANGAVRIALPAELPAPALAALAGHAGGVELEVQAFGRLPLAISARCYHARIRRLHKDGCRYVCGADDDGLDVDTLDGQPFLAVNGTQTLSHTVCNLLGELRILQAGGIGCFRLWPHRIDMVAVAALYRAVLDGQDDAAATAARLAELVDFAPFANGFIHGVEGALSVASTG